VYRQRRTQRLNKFSAGLRKCLKCHGDNKVTTLGLYEHVYTNTDYTHRQPISYIECDKQGRGTEMHEITLLSDS
jgi:hypothetical protein